MKKVFNIAVIVIVLIISYITTIILKAHFSTSIGYSITFNTYDVVIPLLILVGSSVFYFIYKSWKMLVVSVVGLIEMLILGLILLI